MEGFKEENPDDETDPDELSAKLEAARKQQEKTLEEFKAKCAPSVMSVNMAEVAAANMTAQALHAQIRNRLLPKVYVLVAPSGASDFSGLIANTICTSRREGKRPVKFTIIDSNALFRPGGHSSAIEDKLSKAAFTSEAPDAVPATLWKELLTENSYYRCVNGGDFDAYSNFEGQVKNATLVQFGADKIKECVIDQVNSPEEAAQAVAADFLSFQEKAEQAKR